jgi:hypothetical protein
VQVLYVLVDGLLLDPLKLWTIGYVAPTTGTGEMRSRPWQVFASFFGHLPVSYLHDTAASP